MNVAEVARYWYDRNECPGCGAALTAVAGQGDGHVRPHGEFRLRGVRLMAPAEGKPIRMGRPSDDHCPWTADQLAALVHIGSGLVTVR